MSAQDWRRSKEYRLWRVSVIRRDSRCVICDSLIGREAHHINHSTYFPEQRFLVENGVTLCRKCHSQFHTNYKSSFREKCTLKDFLNFKELIKYFKSLYKPLEQKEEKQLNE